MDQRRSLVLIAALALGMATFGQSRGAEPQSDTDHAGAPKAGQAVDKADRGVAPAASFAIEEPLEALDALADAFGVDITAESIHRRLARETTLAAGLETPDARVDDAKRVMRQFVSIALPTTANAHAFPSLEAPRNVNVTKADAGRLSRVMDEYFASAPKGVPATLTKLKIAILQEAARRQATRVRFLIATLPDPIDSFTGWQFDPMLDAIVQAIAASDFLFDRSRLSDADPPQGAAAADRGRQHERESSVLLFRRHLHAPREAGHAHHDEPAADDEGRQLLVLLIVHENPSSGLHLPALLDAVRLVTSWEDQPSPERRDGGQCLAILGPTFSRSADSIAQALQIAHRRQMLDRVSRVRVLSGSATDDSNKWLIEHALDASAHAPAITFHATVQPDSLVLPELIRFAYSLGWSHRAAVLFEGDTQYGRSLGDLLAPGGAFGQAEPILLPFPLNVSHIRDSTQDEKLGLGQALGLPSKFRPLSMDAPPMPVDQVPQMSPETTSSYVELGLSTLLQTIRTEQVGTVALMATDPRDKLFLASRVAREAPNVSLVTVDSDSIYYHPDYACYMQGTLVASTYALYGGTQRWSYGLGGGSERHVFANGSAEGAYNAALLLLNYDSEGRAASVKAPRLIDYGMPGEACTGGCEPPVWISVVGGRSAWPLRPTLVARSGGYVQRLVGAEAWPLQKRALDTFPSSAFVALLFALTIVVTVVWVDAVVRRGRRVAAALRSRCRAYVYVALASLISIDAFLGIVWLLHLRAQALDALNVGAVSRVSWFVGIALALPLAAVDVQLIRRLVRRDFVTLPRLLDVRSFGGWVRVGGAGVGLWAAGNLAAYLWACATLPPVEAASFVARATDLTSGVSPALPIVFLFSAFALWGVTEPMRYRDQTTALADEAVQPLMQQAVSGRLDTLTGAWARLAPSMLAAPPAFAGIVAIGTAATCFALFDPFVRPLVTIEGVLFGRVISSAILVLQVMTGLALLQFVYLWWVLKRLLERLAHHSGPDGYVKVPRGLFPAQLFPQRPALDDLEVLVEYRMACLTKSRLAGAAELQRVFEAERNATEPPHWSASATWRALLAIATLPPAAAGTVSSPGCDVVRLREMCVTLVVRDAIARLWHNVVFVIGAVLCVFCAHTLFPFRIQRALEEVGWFYVAVAFGAILTVLVQMRGDELLRRVASPDPAKGGGWDTGFVLKLAIFVLVPLLTLFAAQFPDAGGVLMRWVEPVRKILP